MFISREFLCYTRRPFPNDFSFSSEVRSFATKEFETIFKNKSFCFKRTFLWVYIAFQCFLNILTDKFSSTIVCIQNDCFLIGLRPVQKPDSNPIN